MTAVNSLNKCARCVTIFLHERTIKRPTMIKREESNSAASFSLKVTSEDTYPLAFMTSLLTNQSFEYVNFSRELRKSVEKV